MSPKYPSLVAAAAAMDERGGAGKKTQAWPWWAGATAAQLTTGLVWFRRGKSGGDMAMPFKAFAIATLFVGAGATAVTAGVSAAGVGSVSPGCKNTCARARCDESSAIWLIFHRCGACRCSLSLQVEEMKDLGARIRRWSRVPPRRVEGSE